MIQNFKISHRLITSFVIVALFSFIVGITGYQTENTLGEQCLPSIQALGSIEKDLNSTIASERGFLVLPIVFNQGKRELLFSRAKSNMEHVDSAIKVYEALPFAPGEYEMWQAFLGEFKKWRCNHDSIIIFANQLDEVIKKGASADDKEFKNISADIATQVVNSREGWLASIEALDKVIEQNRQTAEDSSQSGRKLMLTFSILALLLSLALGVFISSSIVNPIKRTTDMLKDIAEGEGDLTKRLVPQGKDEIAELCNWFNTFVTKIQDVVVKITGSTETLTSASEELSATSTQIATSAKETSIQTTAVAAASEQASANLKHISSASEQVSHSISTIAAAIEEMSASLRDVAQNCQGELRIATEASVQAESARTHMEELGEVAKQVDRIIEVISDIADQTNLLALNATIEAASAGEAGKGFAVVAGEVKELARQTAQATTDIGEQIKKMQSSTNTAIKSILGIVEVISKINATSQSIVKAVDEQSHTITDLSKSVAQVGLDTKQISSHVTESGKGLSEIASNISTVNDATRSSAAGITQINASTDSLAKLAGQLDQIVHQFKA